MQKVKQLCSVAALLAFLGCVESQQANSAAPVPTVQAESDIPGDQLAVADETGAAPKKEVKFPELPKGAGAMDKDAPKTFQVSKTGLKYRVLRKGKGKMPKATDSVTVHYHGWLDNGKVFDSSYRRGETIEFGLNQVIKGWTEGLQYVDEGGMLELEIPPDLGYGNRGAGADIPPGATLHFLVELKQVN